VEIRYPLHSDGITRWKCPPANPIIRAGENKWDHDSHCRPFAIFVGQRWLLWYNGRHGDLGQIGLVIRKGEDLEFSNFDSVSNRRKHAACYAMIGALMAFIFSQSDESDAAQIERWIRRTKA
jgi:hypothetical protein